MKINHAVSRAQIAESRRLPGRKGYPQPFRSGALEAYADSLGLGVGSTNREDDGGCMMSAGYGGQDRHPHVGAEWKEIGSPAALCGELRRIAKR